MACDAKGRETAEEWIAAANPTHPSLLDPHFVVAGLYNTRNVPAAFWIDESGRVVRGNDPIYALTLDRESGERTPNARYLDGVRDWVANGAASRFVTDAAETARRIGTPDAENAQASTHFLLGVYLQEQGRAEEAIEQFTLAHALKPENWNYKRQAWALGDLEEDYGLTREQAFRGGIPLYPSLELPEPEASLGSAALFEDARPPRRSSANGRRLRSRRGRPASGGLASSGAAGTPAPPAACPRPRRGTGDRGASPRSRAAAGHARTDAAP